MKNVYIPHPVMRRVDGKLVSRIDMNQLAGFGHIRFLMEWKDLSRPPAEIIALMRRGFAHYGFSAQDYIVMAGHPVMATVAVNLALELDPGQVTMLYWDQKRTHFAQFTFLQEDGHGQQNARAHRQPESKRTDTRRQN